MASRVGTAWPGTRWPTWWVLGRRCSARPPGLNSCCGTLLAKLPLGCASGALSLPCSRRFLVKYKPMAVVDGVILAMSLVPFMVTNLKAPIDPEVGATDASPSGGGAAVATELRRPANIVDAPTDQCYECNRNLEDGSKYPCPADCGGVFCTLACVMEHRDVDHASEQECPRRAWRPPRFGERFAGHRAPLSHAVAMVGHIEVRAEPSVFGHNILTDEGKRTLSRLTEDEFLAAEHWAPECKPFSKARGRPVHLDDGTRLAGPQPVRDRKHIMGFPWLSGDMKARVRRANNKVLGQRKVY